MTTFSARSPPNRFQGHCNDQKFDHDWVVQKSTVFFLIAVCRAYNKLKNRNLEGQLYSYLKNHTIRMYIELSPTDTSERKFELAKHETLPRKDTIPPHSDTYDRDCSLDCFIQLVFNGPGLQGSNHATLYANLDDETKLYINDNVRFFHDECSMRECEELIEDFKQHTISS